MIEAVQTNTRRATCHPDRALKAKGLCQACYAKQDRYRDMVLRKHYGITLEQYQEMLTEQKGCCAICGKEAFPRLAVDHDHVTGEVRGLLCMRCNHGLGNFDDNPKIVEQAIIYLRRIR